MTKQITTAITTLGWDIGGAHLKAALVDADGVALAVIQEPCPLWRGVHELQKAMDAVLDRLHHQPDRHIVTMTAELVDIFADRTEGVREISRIVAARLGANVWFYAGHSGLVNDKDVIGHTAAIASANWLASAAFVARKVKHGLLLDIGSTTTDLILLRDGRPQNCGFSDAERMQLEELVYTGVVRTSLMALGSHVQFGGEHCAVAAEHFATTSDIYRLTGDLLAAEDMADTADNLGKTLPESARRLARMIGRDIDDAPMSAWIGLARAFKQAQLNMLKDAVLRSLSRDLIGDDAPVIGAGAGSFLAKELAVQLNREYLQVETLILADTIDARRWASVCLPAYAVACMEVAE